MPGKENGRWVTMNGSPVFIPNNGGAKSGVGRLAKSADGDRKQINFLRALLAEGGHSKRDRREIEKKMEQVSKRILNKS